IRQGQKERLARPGRQRDLRRRSTVPFVAERSSIEWTESTWNQVTGCSKVSPGCAHCCAETFAERWRGVPGHHYEQGFDLRLWPHRLVAPSPCCSRPRAHAPTRARGRGTGGTA